MSKSKISRLTLANAQIKSAEIFVEVCKAIDTLEKLTFIRSGEIAFTDNFICPDFDLLPFYNSADPTQRLIARLCIHLHYQKHGENIPASYLEVIKSEQKRRSNARK